LRRTARHSGSAAADGSDYPSGNTQAPRLERFADLAEEPTEFDSVSVAEKDRLTIYTPVGDVMKAVGRVEA